MTDRQDIDALLIGALYGELTPADEGRLTAHLESHPQDRGALDDLKSARAKVLESRIFELQAEPPQHISALLLQEAHRRAPKMVITADGEEKQSWFWRFARSFMLHPAMAAAAMLVVVLGVGALMYKNKGADFANREVQPPASTAPSVALESNNSVAAGSAAPMPDPSYRAGLAEDNDLKAADQGAAEGAKENSDSAAQRWRDDGKDGDLAKAQQPARNKNAIAVTTEQPQPKDFENDRAEERQAAQHGAQNAEKAKVATKGAATKSDGAKFDLDGADDFGGTGTATGRAPGAGAGGGTTNGIVVGGLSGAPPATTAPSTGAVAGPSGAVAGNRGYAQPPPPPPAAPATDKSVATKTTTTATTTPTAPKQEPAKVATPTAKPTSPQPVTKSPAPAPKSDAKAGESKTAANEKSTATDSKKVATQKPPAQSGAGAPAPVATPPADSTLVGWAKSQHARAVALAKDGKCQSAAQVALGVSQKAPDYYASFMASDRQLKSCKQYIDDARDREAEKSAKSRAQKRVNADEEAPANVNAK